MFFYRSHTRTTKETEDRPTEGNEWKKTLANGGVRSQRHCSKCGAVGHIAKSAVVFHCLKLHRGMRARDNKNQSLWNLFCQDWLFQA